MFSDTHFHLQTMIQERNIDGEIFLKELSEKDVFFCLDIGTKSSDLSQRFSLFQDLCQRLPQINAEKAEKTVYFTAGIWPSVEEIQNREQAVKTLSSQMQNFKGAKNKLIALGECGIDHHWNIAGCDKRNIDDFDKSVFDGERELFLMQLGLAKKMDLPVVIHSRDAFEDTFNCIKESGWNKGIIHCFSYGISEARKFLDCGWHLALGGSLTYTKKSKLEEIKALLNYIPKDALLFETDSPYLAPVPFRGQTNTPLLIPYIYEFAANLMNTTAENLSEQTDINIKKLFRL